MYLAWGVAIFAVGVWLALVLVVVTRKGVSLRVRLGSIALGFIVPLGLWGLFSYDPGLVHWASHLMSHEVDLSWNAPTDSARPISGYHVYRATAGSSSYQLLNRTVVTQTKFVDLTVQSGHTYDYFVKSVDASTGVESGPSNTIRVTIPWIPNLVRRLKAKDH
jgi:hypothetical protein